MLGKVVICALCLYLLIDNGIDIVKHLFKK